ncbi:MAG: metallophosphatase [Syntrophaceae bacterium CG2_30_49_12]|nr:MAG: metallophosphatase [Syntrophaceae bacterium CG2_30_49_12]PIP05918.1 MAG: metallophosphatase [Syntrophobacterales bacterium CG23_combo_of_CG06-09_8_20_14_all_48_27]PJA49533.1 MAG: serine/threonine protein phosphatase [Syntrophobacterales bacterium CG_4_9_14_3_um_filter_49_8]PJC75911.1 MAG: serine/threonine protein phosphatase [Syntrophobacterales bacterium CG_4_8_14_3_um_filter_49_14]
MGKIFAVGDIHSCLFKLKEMMTLLKIDPVADTLVFVGDYIDRGPDACGVVDLILRIKRTVNKVICLLGNHEQLFLDYYLEKINRKIFLSNGGMSTLLSYGLNGTCDGNTTNIPESHLQFFNSLYPYYETDDYIFVHAGLKPGIPLEQQDRDDILWIRNEFIASAYDFGKIVVFGHTPFSVPLVGVNKIGIDTGAVYGGKLTCVELPEIKIHQV